MSKKIWKFLAVLFLLSFFSTFSTGCYYFSAKKEISNAEKLFSELKATGGQTKVPYEYCSSEKFLEASKIEFSQNDFGPAKAFAERSKSAAEAGLAEIKKK
ncbi:MAG: hypothetical protein ACE144_09630 [Thermodesulfobacteriota bacterium]